MGADQPRGLWTTEQGGFVHSRRRIGRGRLAAAGAGALAAAMAIGGLAVGSAGAASSKSQPHERTLHVAYLSYAVQNSYDAPMLAAAEAQAKKDNVVLKVFDANNNPTTQYSQFQDAITSHQYQGIIVQPIFGTALMGLAKQAIKDGIQVANLDQTMGPNLSTDQPQVKGLAVNVVFVDGEIGTKLGELVVKACANLHPCRVGYLYDIKISALDGELHKAFMAAIAGHKNVRVVATGQDYYSPALGLKAVQNMLTAQPNLNLIVGTDQGLEGGLQALSSAGKLGKVILVGYGASAAAIKAIKTPADNWYGDVAQLPASEGRLAVEDLAWAIRTGILSGGVDPVAELPDAGVVTKANVNLFTPEWPG